MRNDELPDRLSLSSFKLESLIIAYRTAQGSGLPVYSVRYERDSGCFCFAFKDREALIAWVNPFIIVEWRFL